MKAIEIEPINEDEFEVIFSNASVYNINLKDALSDIISTNSNIRSIDEPNPTITADLIHSFHLDSNGVIHWSHAYWMDSDEIIRRSSLVSKGKITEVPNILSRICCIEVDDVISKMNIDPEAYSFWQVDPHSSPLITSLMILFMSHPSSLMEMEQLKKEMLK